MCRNFLIVLGLFFSLGCQPSLKGTTENASYVTYKEAEFGKDFRDLEQAEEDLQSVGLKFKKEELHSSDAVLFVWNVEFLKKSADKELQAKALKNYIEKAELFLSKYSNPFYVILEKEETTLLRQIKHSLQVDLLGKINKAKSSLVESGT